MSDTIDDTLAALRQTDDPAEARRLSEELDADLAARGDAPVSAIERAIMAELGLTEPQYRELRSMIHRARRDGAAILILRAPHARGGQLQALHDFLQDALDRGLTLHAAREREG